MVVIVSEELTEALGKKSLNTTSALHTEKDLNILDMIKLRRFLWLHIIKIIFDLEILEHKFPILLDLISNLWVNIP